MKHLVCTGGGSAGHVVPAIPVMAGARERGARVSFIGSRSGLEARLLAAEHVDYHGIAAGKLRRYLSVENALDVFRVSAGVWQAYRLLGRLAPDVVFSKGGFVSFPVVLAAWLRGLPVVAHESDLSPGLANRLALPFVETLCVTFAETQAPRLRGRRVVTGTPLRTELLEGDAARGRALLQAPEGRPVLLVTGGSLGADAVNRAVRGALEALLEVFVVVHVCGPGKDSGVRAPGYHPYEFVSSEWGDLLAAADLVVSRAGANSLFELLALGKPNLLIPLSPKVSRGDQVENAEYARARGYSRVLSEEQLTPERLLAEVLQTYRELPELQRRLAEFRPPDAVTAILDQLEAAAVLRTASPRRVG
jgi:UDP-N-acetylglucosamine--N-acetylmuramyl-(pentapeptide) pyrophosphoryl-undecaprenol N-acetylglucosamine transferase